jgi:hypothetical protein
LLERNRSDLLDIEKRISRRRKGTDDQKPAHGACSRLKRSLWGRSAISAITE